MLLHSPELVHVGSTLRSTARLTGDQADESMWFEAPIDRPLNGSIEPFIPPAVVIATVRAEAELFIDGDVSESLLAGARQAAAWFALHLGRPPVDVMARGVKPAAAVVRELQQTGLFFSRGVDSTSNLVRGEQGELQPTPDLAIVIDGIEPANSGAVEAGVNERTVAVARSFGLDSVVVSTNLRLVLDRHAQWIEGFGSVLAGTALFLAPGLSDVIISSAEASQQCFSGSHPDIDPLWSDGNLRIHHLPVGIERSERVRMLVEDGRPMSFLRVCVTGGPQNCGSCDKCMQTSVLISAFGGDPTTLFLDSDVTAQDLREDPPNTKFRRDFVTAARAGGQHGAADAVEEVLDAPANGVSPRGLHDARDRLGTMPDVEAGSRPLAWLAIGPASEALATILDRAGELGPGCVLGEGDLLTEHVRRAAMRRAQLTIWPAAGAPVDALRTVECLRSGSRPLIIHPADQLGRARAEVPAQLAKLVGSTDDIVAAATNVTDDLRWLTDQATSGGIGWLA